MPLKTLVHLLVCAPKGFDLVRRTHEKPGPQTIAPICFRVNEIRIKCFVLYSAAFVVRHVSGYLCHRWPFKQSRNKFPSSSKEWNWALSDHTQNRWNPICYVLNMIIAVRHITSFSASKPKQIRQTPNTIFLQTPLYFNIFLLHPITT